MMRMIVTFNILLHASEQFFWNAIESAPIEYLKTLQNKLICIYRLSVKMLEIFERYMFSEGGFCSVFVKCCMISKSNTTVPPLEIWPRLFQTKACFMLLSFQHLSFYSAFSSLLHVINLNWVFNLSSLGLLMATGVATLKMNDVLAELVARSQAGLAWALLCKIFPTMKNTEDILISSDFSTNNDHDLQEVARVLVALNELGRLMQKKVILCSPDPEDCINKHWAMDIGSVCC